MAFGEDSNSQGAVRARFRNIDATLFTSLFNITVFFLLSVIVQEDWHGRVPFVRGR